MMAFTPELLTAIHRWYLLADIQKRGQLSLWLRYTHRMLRPLNREMKKSVLQNILYEVKLEGFVGL